MSDKLFSGIKAGSTDVSIPVLLRSTGTSIETTGKAYTDITSASYWRQSGTRTAITPATLGSVNASHADGGFIQVDATNMPGVYRLDVPDAAFATGADWVVVSVVVSGSFVYHVMFALSTDVIQTGDSFARIGSTGSGLTSLASAANLAVVDTIVDRLDTMMVADGGVYQFTANALELGPTTAYGGPTAAQIRTEMDSNSTKLANLDATITSRMATFTVPGSFATANFALLANLNATVGSRLAAADFTQRSEPPTASAIADAVWDELVGPGYHNTANSAGHFLADTQTLQNWIDGKFYNVFQIISAGPNNIQSVTTKLLDLIELDGSIYRFTANALEQSPALVGGAGTATLENQQAILAALSTGNVTVTSPVSPDGSIITLVEGDTYQATDGRQLDFTSADWPVLTGGSFNFKVGSALTVAASVTAARIVRVQLSAANTTALSVGKHTFHIDGTLANGNHITLVIGSVFVKENQ